MRRVSWRRTRHRRGGAPDNGTENSRGQEGGGAGDDDGDFVQFAVSPDRHTTFAISCNQSGIDIVGQLRELEEIWLGEALE